MIKKESGISGILFIGYGTTMTRTVHLKNIDVW